MLTTDWAVGSESPGIAGGAGDELHAAHFVPWPSLDGNRNEVLVHSDLWLCFGLGEGPSGWKL